MNERGEVHVSQGGAGSVEAGSAWPARTPVIRDVAAAAGVSAQTVSRVVNRVGGVSDRTRERVQRVIDELGYRPNAAAQALAAGRERRVHVLTSETTLYGHATILRGIEGAAAAEGYQLSVSILDQNRAEQTLAASVAGRTPTILFAIDVVGLSVLDLLTPQAPLVVVGEVSESSLPSVVMDERVGAARATEHLLELGHSSVHYVSVPVGELREAGWSDALRAAGLARPRPWRAGWDPASGAAATRDLLSAHPDVTALLCGNDDLALGALLTLRRAGLRVPADVSVVGFDDVPGAAYFAPPLTTVSQDFAALGRAAFDLLLALVEPRRAGQVPPAARSVRVQPHLVVRESSGPAPAEVSRGR